MLAARRQFVHDFQSPVACTAFLVAGNQQRETAVVIRMLGQEIFQRYDHGGKAAFHIRGATAIEQIADERRLEGSDAPFVFVAGRDNVGMPGKTHDGCCCASPGPQVGDVIELQRLAFETQLCQPIGEQKLAAGIVGSDGTPPDQVAQKVDYGLEMFVRHRLNSIS